LVLIPADNDFARSRNEKRSQRHPHKPDRRLQKAVKWNASGIQNRIGAELQQAEMLNQFGSENILEGWNLQNLRLVKEQTEDGGQNIQAIPLSMSQSCTVGL
jgi:hypothetical protein